MNQSKLVLVDSTEINLQDGTSLGNMCVVFADKQAMIATWERLTTANLKCVQVMTDGVVSGQYTELILDHEKSVANADGSVLTSFAIRAKTEIEIIREEMTELKASQGIQDGAIADLGAITSEVVEKMEGGTQ